MQWRRLRSLPIAMFRSALLSDSDFDDDCPACRGSAEPGWTCEDHPGKPWQHAGCHGAGAPCVCNPRGAALWAMVYSDALRVAEAMRGADAPVH
jgi:hypothetical protein